MTGIKETVRVGKSASRSAWFLAIVPIVLLAGFVSLMPVDAAGSEPQPTEAIKGTVTDLFAILQEFQGPGRSQARRRAIERVIRRDVHYEDMAKRSLGVAWAQMEDGARTKYVDLFVHLLRDALANRMSQYSDERIRYLSERREAGCAEVKTRLVGSKVDTVIDFRLISQDGRWLVYDAVMDGTSLVGSYRAQFANIIRDASLALLMNRLEENTRLVKLFETHGS
jgi:phospholipid transport system substrate-binding protein